MTAQAFSHHSIAPKEDAYSTPDAWVGLLNTMRLSAMTCRTAARSDLFRACALLATEPGAAKTAYVTAFVKGLTTAWARPPQFLRPGEAGRSFDEMWLLTLFDRCAAKDWPSFLFLLRARIPSAHRESMTFLVHGILRQSA